MPTNNLFLLSSFLLFLNCSAEAQKSSWEQEPVSADPSQKIIVEVKKLKSDKGSVLCALFDNEKGFPDGKTASKKATPAKITKDSAVCEFSGVSPGTYAISLFHDENSNNTLDTNFIGIPKEGLGASNDAKASFGPPKFKDAKFEYKGGELKLTVNIVYL